ncbi:MAG: hypothetical protein H6622_12240 [Halobacteriovoraceae bacterium]|nr:hypothetical protein [Halobacteriovoraceae bacterium]
MLSVIFDFPHHLPLHCETMNPMIIKIILFKLCTVLTLGLYSLQAHATVSESYTHGAPQRKINIALANIRKSYLGLRTITLAKSYGMKHPRFHCHKTNQRNNDIFDEFCDQAYGVKGRSVVIHYNLMDVSSDYLSFVLVLAAAEYLYRHTYDELNYEVESTGPHKRYEFAREIQDLAFVETMEYWKETLHKSIDFSRISSFIKDRQLSVVDLFDAYQVSKENLISFLNHRRESLDIQTVSIYEFDNNNLTPKGLKQKKKLIERLKNLIK